MNSPIHPRFTLNTASVLAAGLLASLGLAATTPAQVQRVALEWPQFRGPGGLATSKAQLPTKWSISENIAWKTPLPGQGTSSPIVVGDRIFLTYYTGTPAEENLEMHILCLGRSDGRTIWDKAVKAVLPEQEKIREGHGYASSTPAADGERLYVFFGKTGVFAFAQNDGRELWRTDVGSKIHGWGSAASPVLYRDMVLINASVESESLVALNNKTGKEVWRADGIKEAWNTPLLMPMPGGKHELIVPIMGKILSFNPDNGESLWKCDTGIAWYMCPSPVAHEGIVYCIGGRSGGGLAIRAGGRGDVSNSHVLWKLTKGSNVSSPIYYEGHVYFAHENLGVLYCVDAKSGSSKYEERLSPSSGQIYASPILAGGNLYYVSRNGHTFVVPAKPSFEILAHNEPLERGMFNASPAVAGKRLLLRSDKNLYCIGAK